MSSLAFATLLLIIITIIFIIISAFSDPSFPLFPPLFNNFHLFVPLHAYLSLCAAYCSFLALTLFLSGCLPVCLSASLSLTLSLSLSLTHTHTNTQSTVHTILNNQDIPTGRKEDCLNPTDQNGQRFVFLLVNKKRNIKFGGRSSDLCNTPHRTIKMFGYVSCAAQSTGRHPALRPTRLHAAGHLTQGRCWISGTRFNGYPAESRDKSSQCAAMELPDELRKVSMLVMV